MEAVANRMCMSVPCLSCSYEYFRISSASPKLLSIPQGLRSDPLFRTSILQNAARPADSHSSFSFRVCQTVSVSTEVAVDYEVLNKELQEASPFSIMDKALSSFGDDIAIAFSGAEDVALLEFAKLTGRRFRVFSLDTGRLNPETYRFFHQVEKHYGISIEYTFPEASAVQDLVQSKGMFSFFEDGHQECCGIRKVQPLKVALSGTPREESWLLVLYAPWCPYCQAMEGAYEDVAREMEGKGVRVGKFQVDRERKEWAKANIQLKSFPTILFLPKGSTAVIKRLSERRDAFALMTWVNALR